MRSDARTKSSSRNILDYSSPLGDTQAFVTRIWLVHDFRKFAYIDPGLPAALLPADWPGARAGTLFREFYAALRPGAVRFFESVLERDVAVLTARAFDAFVLQHLERG